MGGGLRGAFWLVVSINLEIKSYSIGFQFYESLLYTSLPMSWIPFWHSYEVIWTKSVGAEIDPPIDS